MTTVSVPIQQHIEYSDDGFAWQWPGLTVTGVPGYFIVANIGSSSSYTAEDTPTDIINFGGICDPTNGPSYESGQSSWLSGTWTVRGETAYYNGPYACIPAGIAAAFGVGVGGGTQGVDLTDEFLADVEEIGFIETTKDDTGEYPVTTPSGPMRVLSQHVAATAMRKRHAARSHPMKHTWHGIVWNPTVYSPGGVPSTSQTQLGWDSGVLREEGSNAAIQTITGSSTSLAAADTPVGPISQGTSQPQLLARNNQHIIFNNTGTTLNLVCNSVSTPIPDQYLAAVDAYDHTDPAMDEVYWIGQLAPAPDADSGVIWLHNHHGGSHVSQGIHLADKSVHPLKLNSVQSGANLANNSKILAANGSGAAHWELPSNIFSAPVIQTGQSTITSNGSQGSSLSMTVTLSGFTTAPIVVACPGSGSGSSAFGVVTVANITSSQFTLFYSWDNSATLPADSWLVNWIAIGS